MKTKSIVLKCVSAMLIASAALTGCKKDGANSSQEAAKGGKLRGSAAPLITAVLPNNINVNKTLHADTTWIINGPTFVTGNHTLTIDPGTYIKGRNTSATTSGKPSFLLITKGSKIVANGDCDAPIIFTSTQAAGARKPGDWAGVIILGNGINNAGLVNIEGIDASMTTVASLPFPSTIQYGTNISEADATAASKLSYVRIEFAGAELAPDNELNGLTLGGVGSATTLDHIQVSYGADDAFEFFGGSVNAKYLIAQGNNDDDFDFDQGYQGTIQYAVAAKDTTVLPVATRYSSNPNGIECNNITAPAVIGGSNSTRKTNPLLTNLTILGAGTRDARPRGNTGVFGRGVVFRVNANFTLVNSLIGGFDIGTEVITGAAITTPPATFNNFVQAYTTGNTGTSLGTYVVSAANANNSLKLVNPFNITASAGAPDFRFNTTPPPASPANTGFSYTGLTPRHSGGAVTVIETPSYRGAFGNSTSIRWDDACWVSYTPNANVY
jgi:hypothetical protein